MRTILKKTITLETKRFDFDNEFAYIEVWANAQLKDCYFAEKDFIFPDGTIKKGGRKYFFSKYTGEDVEKLLRPIDYTKFEAFDRLYYYDEDGDCFCIDGRPSEET